MTELKLFGKWDTKHITVTDPGLQPYINTSPIIVPESSGRNARARFYKPRSNIVERLINKVMIPGHKGKKHYRTSGTSSGKGLTAQKIVINALEYIEKKTQKNPVEVLVVAIEKAAPREEITAIEYGGARYPQAVDCAPQRRIDIVLRQMVQGAYTKSFGKKVSMSRALADEILKASNEDQASQAISKKLELERQADSSR